MKAPCSYLIFSLLLATLVEAAPAYKVRTEFHGVNDAVYAVAIDEVNQRVYVGGSFTEAAGQPRKYIAAYSSVTGELLPWNPGCNSTVYSIAVDGNKVYIGGLFTEVASQPRDFAAAVDLDGNLLPWNPTPSNYVYRILVSESAVYLCGDFSTVGGVTRTRLANVHKESGGPLFWTPGANGGSVYAFAISGTTVHIGGSFETINGQNRKGLAAVATSTTLLPWDPSADEYVATLHIMGDTIFAGGNFLTVAGNSRNRLAAIDADGNLLPWSPSCDSAPTVISRSGNRLYVGGYFSTVNGQPRTGLAAIDLGGSLLPWNPPAESYVESIAISGGTVFVGGDFASIGGIARQGFAAIYDPALFPKPRVTVKGEKRIETDRGVVRLRGKSVASNRVEVKTKNDILRTAKGVKTWSHRAKLKPGRNKIIVRSANVADATSDPVVIFAYRR